MIKRIVFQKWETGIDPAKCEMQQMENDEGKYHQAAHHHVTRGETSLHVFFPCVALRSCSSILDRELDRKINVNQNGQEKNGSHKPE